jgi:general secretion pathway protein I
MRSEAGFTLIEVMAALVIAALSITVLLQAGFTGAAENLDAGRTEQALSRAQSRLASFGPLTPIQPGTWSGDDGGGYRWQVEITKIQEVGTLGLYAIDLTERFGSRQVVLQTAKLAPAK